MLNMGRDSYTILSKVPLTSVDTHFLQSLNQGPGFKPHLVLAAKKSLHIFSGQGQEQGEVGFSLELCWAVE